VGRTKTIDDERILARARAVFRAGGHAASTRDVARAAGISQAVLYQRFGSKAELFLRAMTPDPPDLESLLGPYPQRNARADLLRIGQRLAVYLGALIPTLLHVVAHPGLRRERLARWHEGLPFHPLLMALTDRFERLRDDGLVGRVDPAAAARAFLAAVHSAALFETLTRHGPPRAPHAPQAHGVQVDALIEVLWAGLAPAGRVRPRRRR
jgi:AcrR family transcriptional regulator